MQAGVRLRRGWYIAMAMASQCFLVACGAPSTAIVGATVIQANGADPLVSATVVISGDEIVDVGRDVRVPAGAKIIDGRGKYLIPGLWEMHIHLSKTRPSAMKLLVANGVTSVRDMGGDIDELMQWRREIGEGDRIGPTIYTAGTYLESPENIARMLAKPVADNVEPVERMRTAVRNPDHAREIVDALADRGVDLIKVREVADDETFVALGVAARANGIALMGHTMGVARDRLIDARIGSIEHFFIPFLDDVPEPERRRFFAELADLGTAFVPNLYLFEISEQTPNETIQAFLDDDPGEQDPRRNYLSKYLLKDWQEQLEQDRTDDRKDFFRRLLPSLYRDIRELREAGVRILPGTDTAVVFVFPGQALHEEIALYVDKLGFTPMQAIEAATRESATFMGVSSQSGTIERGKVADLVLLNGDPRNDIRLTQDIDSVILKGRVFDRNDLDDLVESIRREPDVIEDTWGRYPQGPAELAQ